ncbi:MAG: hypothetical protein L0241_29095 [Planctomycetia bacterium]|nr:hypothetical protein [Planctomycetia bacterium]
MRFRWLAAAAVVFLTSGLASAQPKVAEPTIEVRLRSVNDLLDKAEFVAELAGKEESVKQVRELIKVLSMDGKGIDGIDPKRPIGAYATLDKDIATSPVVVMVPIADEETFLTQLNARYGFTVEKGKDGTHKVVTDKPGIEELHLRFANGYVYIARAVKDIDPKGLIQPKAYFAKDDGSVASVLVRIDQIPDDLKKFALGYIELALNEERKKNAENETAAEKQLKGLVLDAVLAGFKGLTNDGKELSVRVFADPKTDELSAEVTLTAKNGSATAKNFSALGSKTSLPAGIVAVTNPAARANVKIAVTDGMRKEYVAAIDALLADVKKNAPAGAEDWFKQLADAIEPSLKAGELDAAASLIGPDAKGRYQLIAALGVKDGKKIEKFVKDLAPFIGEAGEFTFDIEKIGDFALHRIDLRNTPDEFEKAFGTKSIWLGVSDKHLVLSIEPDGATIKKGLKAKAVPVAVMSGEVSLAKLLPLIQPDLKPDELKALIKDAFGDGPTTGKDTIGFSVEGGDKLTVKFKVKGKAVRLGAGLDLLKGK